jgi:tetratricopeptide (TPR) repeat protein
MTVRNRFQPLAVAIVLAAATVTVQSVPVVSPDTPHSGVAPHAQPKVEEAFRALSKGELDKAATALEEALKLDPKSPIPMLGLAEVARLRKRAKLAEDWLKKALSIAPDDAQVQLAWGRYQYAARRLPQAEASFKRARELDPKSVAAHLDLGELYLTGMGRPKEAEAQFREAIRLRPDHGGAHNGLGMALAAQGQVASAAAEFEEAARLAPDNPLPLHALGRLHLARGDADKALAAYDRALKLRSDFAPALLERGDAYLLKKQPDKAAADYLRVTKLLPKNATAHFKLGMLYQAQNRPHEALAAYRAAIDANARYALAYNNLAWLTAERKGNLKDALIWAKKAVEIAPEVGTFQDTLGYVHRARGELDAAIAAFRKAAASKPPQAEFHYRLGLALAEKGNRTEAVAALRKALEINWDFPEAAEARKQIEKLGG